MPGGNVAPPGANHFVIFIQFNHPSFTQLHVFRGADQIIQLKHIIIAGRDETSNAGAFQFLIGVGQPLLGSFQHLRGI